MTDLIYDGVHQVGVEKGEESEEGAGQSTDQADTDCPPDKVHTNQTERSHLSSLLYLLITNQ